MTQPWTDLYDEIYSFKDYAGEAKRLHEIVQGAVPGARTLLDVACGTGAHLERLKSDYEVEGVDLETVFVEKARHRNPGVEVSVGDMRTFHLGKQFDAVTCLFSSIGFMNGAKELGRAVSNMADHVRTGGVLIVEPWLYPENFIEGHVGAAFVNEPELKVARLNTTEIRDRMSVLHFEYLIGADGRLERVTEDHELYLFTRDEYAEAFEGAGLTTTYDESGLIDRGLWIGIR